MGPPADTGQRHQPLAQGVASRGVDLPRRLRHVDVGLDDGEPEASGLGLHTAGELDFGEPLFEQSRDEAAHLVGDGRGCTDPLDLPGGLDRALPHDRTADVFDVAKFPKITFVGSKLIDVNADRTKGKLEGTLTIKDVSKPVVLDVEWYGIAKDPFGNEKANFSGKTTVNRKDFGIIWNKTLDAGGYLVGDEVVIEINVEAQIPKTPAPQ